MSVVKVCSLVAMWTLHVAFAIQAYKRDLDAYDYIGFAVGVAIISGMPIANHLVNAVSRYVPNRYAQGSTETKYPAEPGA